MISKELRKVAEEVIKSSLRVIPKESLLVLYDAKMANIAKAIKDEGEKVSETVFFVEMPPMEINGDIPPGQLIDMMKSFDVVVAATSKSINHTAARHQASKVGVRVASIGEMNEEIFIRDMSADRNQIEALNGKIKARLENANIVRVTSQNGTDISMTVTGRHKRAAEGRLYTIGSWGTLPSGEVYVAPIEEETNGSIVVDGSIAEIGLIDEPISIEIMDGSIIEIAGKGKKTTEFQELMNDMEIEARTIGEFGIGTNPNAKLSGYIASDEKVLGTCHFAFGNNFSFGGTLSPSAHIDCVINAPTVEVDGTVLIKGGQYVETEPEEES